MRTRYVEFLLAATAVTHATKATTTTSVAVSTTNSPTEPTFTADKDKIDGMMNSNVMVNEVLAEAKSTTFATESPTQPSEKSTYIAEDDGERVNVVEGCQQHCRKV